MGKAHLRFEELGPSGSIKPEIERTVSIPEAKKTGNLNFRLTNEADLALAQPSLQNTLFYDNLDPHLAKVSTFSSLPLIYYKNNQLKLQTIGTDPVLGELGADHDPWYDQGITPFGEYFENNQEYVSMHTGFLTITSTDLHVPGRGLDLSINRVYAPPVAYEGAQPAAAPDYSYQDYPWAPMGNGWMLGFPWIELDGNDPAYIRFPGGQRYEWNGSSTEGREYHSGDRFTLYSHANGNLTMYTIDGIRYDFDSFYKPKRISDPDHNEITFQYTNDVITTITDTVGRDIDLAYDENNNLSNITSCTRVVSYQYEAGTNGYRLVSVTDPVGRESSYEYLNDYLINKTLYPTGGSTWYTYSVFEEPDYTKYRVSSQAKYPDAVPENSTTVLLDNVKNIMVFEDPNAWGFVKALDWVGEIKYTNPSFILLGWQLITGHYHLWKGYLEWDTSPLPDDSSATYIKYIYDCFDPPEGEQMGEVMQMDHKPSLSDAVRLFDDIGNGTSYQTGSFPTYGDYQAIELNSYARTDFDNNLDDNWFAIGVQWISGLSGQWCQFDTGSNAKPKGTLHVEYNDPVEARYVEGASYVSFNFDSTFYQINNTIIKHSNGVETVKTTRLDYKQGGFTETVWNGTESDATLYLENTDIDDQNTRRRIRVEHYPGTSPKAVNKTMWYDNWGNNYYSRDFEDHESYYSFLNTNSMNQFNDTNGAVATFTDSFYTNNINEQIHNRLVGKAELSNGAGSPAIESYYKYDASGNLVEYKDLLSGSWVKTYYDYDDYGNLVKRTDPEGNKVFCEYNSTYGHAYLTKYIQQLDNDSGDENVTRHFGYDSDTGSIVYSVDERGNRTDYSYDEIGRILEITYPSIEGKRCSKQAAYNDAENTVTIYNENGDKVKKTFDGLGRLILSERYDDADVYSNESYVYNWQNQIATHVLPSATNYTYYYDALGKPLKTINPDGSSRRTVYDYIYNTETVYDEENRKKMYYYDWSNRLTEVREFNDTACYYATFYTYDEAGNLLNTTNGVHFKPVNYTRVLYSQADAYVSVPYPNNNYPTGNMVLKEGDSYQTYVFIYFNTTTIPRDSNVFNANLSMYFETAYGNDKDFLIYFQKVTSEWEETTITYNNQPDTNGTLKESVYLDTSNDNGYLNWTVTKNVQFQVRNPHKSFGYFGYSDWGWEGSNDYVNIRSRQAAQKPLLEVKYSAYTKYGQQRSTIYTYDQLGRLTSIDYPDSTSESYTYDDVGNMLTKVDQNGNTTLYSHDSLNRLVNTTYNRDDSSLEEILYIYDPTGNLLSSSSGDVTTSYQYDARNRVTKETFNVNGSVNIVEYSYDNASRVDELTYPDSSIISYSYDGVGRVDEITGYAEFTHNVDDLIETIYYQNGVQTTYSYDSRERPVNIVVRNVDSGPWLQGYGKRICFTVESDRLIEDLTIPIRLVLSGSAGIDSTDVSAVFDELGSSYKKLAVTTDDGVSEVDQVEVTRWDSGNEEAELWFRATVDGDTDTSFYLYYDSSHADNSNVKNPGEATNIWPTGSDERYIAVYHMGEASGDLIDSTGNSFDAAVADLESRQINGYNGGYAVSFEPQDYLTLGDLNLEGDELTVMVVANIESDLPDSGTLVGCWPQADQYILYDRNEAGGDYIRALAYLSNGQLHTIQSSTSDITTGQWATWTNTFSKGAFFRLYKDRSIKSSLTPLNYPIRSPSPTSFNTSVGAVDTDNDGYYDDIAYFDGQIDCIVIARSAFTEGQVDVYTYGFEDDLVHWGVEETGSGGGGGSWLSGWGQRIDFSVESDRFAGSFTAPIRLVLSASAGIGSADVSAVFDELGSGYKKLAVTTDDGVSEVGQVEVARWDSGSEEAELWFRAAVDGDADTGFYLYYDSSHTDNTNVKDPGEATGIWPTGSGENYIAVYHLGEATGSLIDSTSNSFDGSIGDLESRQVNGYNGGYAVSFEPLDYFTLGDLNLEGDELTVMVVANIESDLPDSGTLVGCWPQADQYILYDRNEAGGDYIRALVYLSNGQLHTIQSSISDITTGQWATWTNTFSRGAFYRLYKDRSVKSSLTPLNYPIRSPSPPSFNTSVGAVDTDNDGYYDDIDDFDGQIDCIVIARSAFNQSQIDLFTYGFEDDLVNWGSPQTPGAGEVLLNLTYTYDGTGSVTQIVDGVNNVTETYGYDLLDRLNGATGSWGAYAYTYDSAGNRLSRSVQGGSTVSYTYDGLDRLISATGMGFDWDLNGNLLYMNDGSYGWNYTYDSLNRLTKVHKDSTISAIYTYDAEGRRVRSWDTVDGTTDYVYRGLYVIDEVRGGAHERHVYAGSMHLASSSSGTIEYFHVDHLGSTRLKTNSTGGAIYESNYEPYGPGIGESGSEEFRYTGKQEDATGLYYYGARYYDPATGRFTTRDTFPGYRRDPQSQNPYSYSRNNPHKYSDPTGQLIEPVTGSIGLLIIGSSMLFGYLATNPVVLERLFTIGQSFVGFFSLAPPLTANPSESIEQFREQAWSSYGAYSGTSNPSTVIEQTQNNGITNQANEEPKKGKQSFVSGWFDEEGKQHSTWINPRGELREYVGWTDDSGYLHRQKISHRASGDKAIVEQIWNIQGQTEYVLHYVYNQFGQLVHGVEIKYQRVPMP